MTIDQAKKLEVGDLLGYVDARKPHHSAYRVLKVQKTGCRIEHVWLSTRPASLGALTRDGHESLVAWNDQGNDGNNWYGKYNRIGSNRVGLTQ